MLNTIWISFFLFSALSALYHLFFLHRTDILQQIMDALFKMAETGFTISIGLTGVMALWLGIMRIGESGGMVTIISRIIAPFFRKLFPDVPDNHPAFGAMIMNLAANMLGLDNAATPLGIKAMRELQELNPSEDTASNAQIMFLVINTSSVTLIPVTIFTYLYQLNYPNPTELFIPILIATSCSTLAGLMAVSFYQRINMLQPVILVFILGFMMFISALITLLLSMEKTEMQTVSLLISNSIIFGIVILFISVAAVKKVNVYEEFIQGAKEGFQVAISIIPYLIAMLVAIGVFRASGGLDLLLDGIELLFSLAGRSLDALGILSYQGGAPAFIDALPTGMMKPLSGSGARGMMIETIQTHGVHALPAKMSAVMQGSTETTFYVIAVYFGAVGIKKTRHAVPCGLIADGAGIIAAIIISYLFWG